MNCIVIRTSADDALSRAQEIERTTKELSVHRGREDEDVEARPLSHHFLHPTFMKLYFYYLHTETMKDSNLALCIILIQVLISAGSAGRRQKGAALRRRKKHLPSSLYRIPDDPLLFSDEFDSDLGNEATWPMSMNPIGPLTCKEYPCYSKDEEEPKTNPGNTPEKTPVATKSGSKKASTKSGKKASKKHVVAQKSKKSSA